MRFGSLSLGCLWSESLGLVLERFFQFFFVLPNPLLSEFRARVRVKRRYLRHRPFASSSLFNLSLPTSSSAQSRGATRVPCSRVMWYRAMSGPAFHLLFFVYRICFTYRDNLFAGNVAMYGPVCHLLLFCVLHLFYFVFRLNTPPRRGAVGAATFHPGYLSFLRLTLRHADGRREVFRMTCSLC